MPSLSQTALEIAVSQLGVHEQGANNAGPEVNEYLRAVRLPPGFAWCSGFLVWCFDRAAKRLGIVNPCPRTAGAVKLWELAEAVCRSQTPAPGLIYVLRHDGGKGHAGIVESVSDGIVTEISGNTNPAGSREGNAVARHAGATPAVVHGGRLLGYINLDLAAQAPDVA
jgi:hypothetical protein